MGKLYTLEDIELETVQSTEESSEVDRLEGLSDESEVYLESIETSLEALKVTLGTLTLIDGIKTSLEGYKLGSNEYFISIENYSPILSNIASNLGIRTHVPSLEDFKNPYGTKASHEITLEGLVEFIKKVWDKIKEIFIEFFKKINMFFRRLLSYDLDLEHYDKYLETMITKIKNKKPTITDNTVMIPSKLPSLLANIGQESINSDFILNNGITKINNLKQLTDSVFQDSLGKNTTRILKDIHRSIKDLFNKAKIEEYLTNIEKTITEVQGISTALTNSLDHVFINKILTPSSLPDEAFRDLELNFTNQELNENFQMRSLLNPNDIYNSLPRNFNAFIFIKTPKLVVTSITETSDNTKKVLGPVSFYDNLVKLYEDYKKHRKNSNIRRIQNSLIDLENELKGIIKTMRNTADEFMTELKRANDRPEATEPLSSDGQTHKSSQINDKFFPESLYAELDSLIKFAIAYYSAMMSLLSSLTKNLVSVNSEISFELAKYIYNSAKLYDV